LTIAPDFFNSQPHRTGLPHHEQGALQARSFLLTAPHFFGSDPTQYDVLWVRHTHEDRVELHFCTPRLELTSGRSLNIAPPGYQKAFDSLHDVMNQRHGWADPMELERVQEVRDTVGTPTRAQGRDELHAWVLDQVSVGLISDRGSMLDALTDAGFGIPRAGKAYLTAQDPDTGERWRFKGEIFHKDWQADPAEREAEHGTGHDSAGVRRHDEVATGELQVGSEQYCDQRASAAHVIEPAPIGRGVRARHRRHEAGTRLAVDLQFKVQRIFSVAEFASLDHIAMTQGKQF